MLMLCREVIRFMEAISGKIAFPSLGDLIAASNLCKRHLGLIRQTLCFVKSFFFNLKWLALDDFSKP